MIFLGHALGLDHSAKRGALMFPTYAGYIPLDTFDLDEDDILGIRSIYGISCTIFVSFST